VLILFNRKIAHLKKKKKVQIPLISPGLDAWNKDVRSVPTHIDHYRLAAAF
jgi:hypothetical protein